MRHIIDIMESDYETIDELCELFGIDTDQDIIDRIEMETDGDA